MLICRPPTGSGKKVQEGLRRKKNAANNGCNCPNHEI
jgi:hypothetical protein